MPMQTCPVLNSALRPVFQLTQLRPSQMVFRDETSEAKQMIADGSMRGEVHETSQSLFAARNLYKRHIRTYNGS